MSESSTTLSPAQQARLDAREGRWRTTSRGVALGYVQCNLVIIPKSLAFEFLLYCQRNSKSCPVLEVTDPGHYEPKLLALGADLRTDLPKYAIYRNGVREEDRYEIKDLWRDDLVAFLIGSGISFDNALRRAGVPTHENRWALKTTVPTVPAGRFHGPLVVTMRWLTPQQAILATQVTSRFTQCHGAPFHIGDPAAIDADLEHPLFGPPVPPMPKEFVPVFWACGVTPQEAALAAKVELMITHAPAHGFITDVLADQMCTP